MGRKRGGLAGFWDRQKKIIKPVATGLAGLLGTPALGAAVGAAMGGLDRPGQSGVGVDLGGAAKGGLSGYGAGKIGSMLGGAAGIGKASLPTLGTIGSGATDVANAGVGNGGGGILGSLGGLLGKVGGAAGSLPGLGKIGSGIGNAVTGNGGMNALAFAQLLNAAQLGKKSGALADEALNTQRDLFAQKAPLRSAGVAGMQAPRTELPQLGKLGATSNPFARPV